MSIQRVFSVAAAAMLAGVVCAQDKPDLKDPKLRSSYCIGADIGGSLKRQELDLDAKALAAGIADAMAGKLALTDVEIREVLAAFREQMTAGAAAREKSAGEKNLKEGEAFLAANAKKDGVKTTASGLQYKVTKAGSGASPKATDEVKVHYHGTLIDGTVFDSSVERKEPITFPVNGVIPGWVEALQLMKVGDKWQIFIPSKLAYGERGPGGKIGPNATLIFDVELLGIEKPGASK
ncbi:MAG: FKBP-type peptidyl-prolyl cis-trans isomerase [Verrucomicrobia bacterium]|nr:MAG: FKBP-type peptidyl-prolyl cis-trans isomerase [Verrucomicrobiota bacterium]